jgi:hypothetical protein
MKTNSLSQLQSTENFEPLNEVENLVTLQKDAVDPIIKKNGRGQKKKLQQQCKKLTIEKLKENKKQKQEDLKREKPNMLLYPAPTLWQKRFSKSSLMIY